MLVSDFGAFTLGRVEWDLCLPCADAVAVMIEAAKMFGELVGSEILSVLCGPCAQKGLEAMGNGPDADPRPTRAPLF